MTDKYVATYKVSGTFEVVYHRDKNGVNIPIDLPSEFFWNWTFKDVDNVECNLVNVIKEGTKEMVWKQA